MVMEMNCTLYVVIMGESSLPHPARYAILLTGGVYMNELVANHYLVKRKGGFICICKLAKPCIPCRLNLHQLQKFGCGKLVHGNLLADCILTV